MNICRRKKERREGYVSSGGAMSVSQDPAAEERPAHRLEALGSKIKNSRSLQSLEVATMDSVRQLVDTATNMGGSMVRVYGSRVELQNRGKYDKFKDDPDCDSDSEEMFRRS